MSDWHSYDLITDTFHVDENFHVDYILAIESVSLTNRLYFKVAIKGGQYYLLILEDYDFHFYELSVTGYSYILNDKTGRTIYMVRSCTAS